MTHVHITHLKCREGTKSIAKHFLYLLLRKSREGP